MITSSMELALRNDGWGDGQINQSVNEMPCVGDRDMNETHFMVLRNSWSSEGDKSTKK